MDSIWDCYVFYFFDAFSPVVASLLTPPLSSHKEKLIESSETLTQKLVNWPDIVLSISQPNCQFLWHRFIEKQLQLAANIETRSGKQENIMWNLFAGHTLS